MYINKSEAKIYDNKINVYGKIIQLGGFPKKILGIQTTNKITFQLVGEKANEMGQFKDSFMKVTGFLSSASIFSKYSLAPMSWEIVSKDKIENFESLINKQFQNIRWNAAISKKWNKILKNMEITLYNSIDDKINILFVEMDIIKLSSGEKKRWYMGVPPEVKPSREVQGKSDFTIIWNCNKLECDENEEMRFELKKFNKNSIFFLLFFLLLKSGLHADDIAYLPGASCGVPVIWVMEKKLKDMPLRALTRNELMKRGRVSMIGQVQYDTLGEVRGMWNIFQNTKWQQTSAVCRKVTDNIYIYVALDVWYDADVNPSGYVTGADVDQIAAKFSTDSSNIYTRTRDVFGQEQEKGLDNDEHVTIFLLDIDNDLALKNNWINKTWVGGYSTRMDDYPDGTNNLHSNERKIIYLDAYPTFEHGKVYYESSKVKLKDSKPTIDHYDDDPGIYFPEGPESIYSILAHEFQHKIHGFYDPDEELWLEEGCSELAGVVNNLSSRSMWPQKSHLKAFFENSNDNLLTWKDSVRDYGVSLMFLTYLNDHFSGDAFINSLVKNKEKGVTSINDNLIDYGFTETFKEIFNKWAIANYFDDTTSFSGVYAYKSIDLFDTLIFKTTPKEPGIYQYGMNPGIRYKLEAPLAAVET
ncbi:hypothetical protein HY745_10340, partial [Candidatus Desantisbacteria bacterium]|nr:hypothetical protein [Candidatus Desantisbacteria bacterium]